MQSDGQKGSPGAPSGRLVSIYVITRFKNNFLKNKHIYENFKDQA
jgi:hypothetical protein